MSEVGPPQAPLRRDAERNRRRILRAAAEAFRDIGLDASHEEIARRAEVSVATVYRRFTDREQLIEALFAERLDAIVEVGRAALEADDAWDGLVAFFERSFALQASDAGLLQLVQGSSHGAALTDRAREQLAPLVDALGERAIAAGALRPEAEPQDLPILQLMLSAVLVAARTEAAQLWRRYLALMLDGLRADGRPRVAIPAGATHEQVQRIMHRLHTS